MHLRFCKIFVVICTVVTAEQTKPEPHYPCINKLLDKITLYLHLLDPRRNARGTDIMSLVLLLVLRNISLHACDIALFTVYLISYITGNSSYCPEYNQLVYSRTACLYLKLVFIFA